VMCGFQALRFANGLVLSVKRLLSELVCQRNVHELKKFRHPSSCRIRPLYFSPITSACFSSSLIFLIVYVVAARDARTFNRIPGQKVLRVFHDSTSSSSGKHAGYPHTERRCNDVCNPSFVVIVSS